MSRSPNLRFSDNLKQALHRSDNPERFNEIQLRASLAVLEAVFLAFDDYGNEADPEGAIDVFAPEVEDELWGRIMKIEDHLEEHYRVQHEQAERLTNHSE